MNRLLAIESSTTVCSVALFENGSLRAQKEIDDGYQHAALLSRYVEDVLQQESLTPEHLDAVLVSKGPGSYTGLRIGMSVAKGICFALNIPLIGITAIEAMAHHMAETCSENDLLIPMIDAGRMEVYCATYNKQLQTVHPLKAEVITPQHFDADAVAGSYILAGNGAEKFREMFRDNPKVIIRTDVLPSAQLLGKPGTIAFAQQRFDDMAYIEPLYVKQFVAGTPKVKGLR